MINNVNKLTADYKKEKMTFHCQNLLNSNNKYYSNSINLMKNQMNKKISSSISR